MNAFDLKLLSKVINVASQLNTNPTRAQSTFSILLLAYYKISCAMSTKEQLLFDPKYPLLIKKLSLLPMDTLANLSINQETFDSIDNATRLKCLHLWKMGMRARVAGLGSNDLVGRRDFALMLYWQVINKRRSKNVKVISMVEEEENGDVYVDPRKSFFNKWRLLLRQRHHQQRLKEARIMFRLKSLLKLWRLGTASRICLRCHQPRKLLAQHLAAWRLRHTRAMIQSKSAEIYSDVRLLRHAVLNWCVLFSRVGKMKPKAERLHRKGLLGRMLEGWRDKRSDKSVKKRLLHRWKSRSNTHREAEMIGVSFYRQKQLVWIKKSFERHKSRIDHMTSLCKAFIDKKGRDRKGAVIRMWKGKKEFNAQKIGLVDEWRLKHDKKDAFKAWSKKAKRFAQADAYYNVNLARRCLRGWNELELTRKGNRRVLDKTFHAWIRHLRDLRSTRFFYGRVLAKKFKGQSIPNISCRPSIATR